MHRTVEEHQKSREELLGVNIGDMHDTGERSGGEERNRGDARGDARDLANDCDTEGIPMDTRRQSLDTSSASLNSTPILLRCLCYSFRHANLADYNLQLPRRRSIRMKSLDLLLSSSAALLIFKNRRTTDLTAKGGQEVAVNSLTYCSWLL